MSCLYIAMVVDKTPKTDREKLLEFQLAQQKIYDDLLEAVRHSPPVEALAEFEALFFGYSASQDADILPFLHHTLLADDETEFRNTLKRACYILVNNWDLSRHSDMVHALLALFKQSSLTKTAFSPSLKRLPLKRLHQWLLGFSESQDFEDLTLFATQRTAPYQGGSWSNRYATYQLTSQYVNKANSLDQREAARTMSRRLKNKFKHDLAMYTAFSQGSSRLGHKYINPTVLGDEVVRLIKVILVRRGQLSYRNVARIFQQQTFETPYANFKDSLLEYMCFSIGQPEFVTAIEIYVGKKLPQLYPQHDEDLVGPSLNLRTCNRLIDMLTTEDGQYPSKLFVRLLAGGNPLNTVVVLLKLVLISPSSRLYLEARLADLIDYYKQFMEAECQGIVQFLEICGITFAIYSNDVEYNLVKVAPRKMDASGAVAIQDAPGELADFRIFSRSFRAAQKRAKQRLAQRKDEL